MSDDEDCIWRGSVTLRWRRISDREIALVAGGFHIGSITLVTTSPMRKETPYRAWMMIDDEGQLRGYYATQQEAIDALAGSAIKEITK